MDLTLLICLLSLYSRDQTKSLIILASTEIYVHLRRRGRDPEIIPILRRFDLKKFFVLCLLCQQRDTSRKLLTSHGTFILYVHCCFVLTAIERVTASDEGLVIEMIVMCVCGK